MNFLKNYQTQKRGAVVAQRDCKRAERRGHGAAALLAIFLWCSGVSAALASGGAGAALPPAQLVDTSKLDQDFTLKLLVVLLIALGAWDKITGIVARRRSKDDGEKRDIGPLPLPVVIQKELSEKFPSRADHEKLAAAAAAVEQDLRNQMKELRSYVHESTHKLAGELNAVSLRLVAVEQVSDSIGERIDRLENTTATGFKEIDSKDEERTARVNDRLNLIGEKLADLVGEFRQRGRGDAR